MSEESWPLTWAPPAPGWMDSEFDESRRIVDSPDAPRVVEWRGHRLERRPHMWLGSCYGFHNTVWYSIPDGTFKISCKAHKDEFVAALSVETYDVAGFFFEGKGFTESAALDAVSDELNSWCGQLLALLMGPPLERS